MESILLIVTQNLISPQRYNEQTQYFTYDIKSFVADFGGYLGLLLGSSLLTFYDLFKHWTTIFCKRTNGMHIEDDN